MESKDPNITLLQHRQNLNSYISAALEGMPSVLVSIIVDYCDRALSLYDSYQQYLKDRILVQQLWKEQLEVREALTRTNEYEHDQYMARLGDNNQKLIDLITPYFLIYRDCYVKTLVFDTVRSVVPVNKTIRAEDNDAVFLIEPALSAKEIENLSDAFAAIGLNMRVVYSFNFRALEDPNTNVFT